MKRDDALARLRRFKTERGEEYAITALGLFGSVVRNTADEESDVDVVFRTDAPNLFRTSRMRQELTGLFGGDVDVVRLRDRMNPRLRARIEQDAVFV